MNTQHTPGVFEIMAEFKSYEIANWLDTTPPNQARALFELGAKIEQHRAELLEALRGILEAHDNSDAEGGFLAPSTAAKARAALAHATGQGS